MKMYWCKAVKGIKTQKRKDTPCLEAHTHFGLVKKGYNISFLKPLTSLQTFIPCNICMGRTITSFQELQSWQIIQLRLLSQALIYKGIQASSF